jgi:phospholipid/cholesterol/gamma-HCH transport system substrate-binding protein
VHYKDGTQDDPRFSHAPGDAGGSTLPAAVDGAAMGDAGTADERAFVDALLAPTLALPSRSVPDIADLLWGPLVRGAAVNLS